MRTPDSWALLVALAVALVAFAVMRGDRPLAVAFATVGRLLTTAWVFVRYAVYGVLRMLRGERDLGPELVRRAFEDLGPTYLKLGQLIASSHGLFPEAYCREFGKTLDRVKPVAYSEIEHTLVVELRTRPERLFAAFEATPLASASMRRCTPPSSTTAARKIAEYIVAFASGDYHALGRVLMSMDAVSQGVDLDAMAADLKKAYAPLLSTSFGDLNYANVLPDILRASVKHRMRLPREFVLVTKQMLYFDRYAKLLAPRLNIFTDPRLVAAISTDVLRVGMS